MSTDDTVQTPGEHTPVAGEAASEPGESSSRSRFSRRTFVGASIAVGGATAVATHFGAVAAGSRPVVRALAGTNQSLANETSVEEKVFNDVCAVNCWQTCYLKAHVRNGRLTKTAMNPFPETRYNRICLRGLSHAQWVYNPARLKFPMKRVGPRGSGRWKRVTWDEALDTIATSMASIRDRYGSKAFAFWPLSGNYGTVAAYGPSLLANVFQATTITGGIDMAIPLGTGQVGLPSVFMGGNESLDLSNADLAVMWGCNLTESMVQEWHFVADAKDRGATLVVIDPNFSITASKADKWIPLRPGSDAAFGLSVLNVLLSEKLYDEAFVISATTLPFLVRDDDGMFLRAGDGKTILAFDPSTSSAQPAGNVPHPALTGSYSVNGVAARPAFTLLAERVAAWTPEYAQQFTQVPPADVRWFARIYAGTKRSYIWPNMGLDRWNNGDLTGRAIATMAAITHNFGRHGAALGINGGGPYLISPASPTGTTAASLNPWLAYDAIDTGRVKMLVPLDGKDPANGVTKDPVEVSWPLKAVWFTTANMVSNGQQTKRLLSLLEDESKLELVVVSDSMPTDTVRYADLILPTTHWFENDDVVSGPTHPYVFRSERAITPPFEAKSDYAAFGLVAQKLGFGKYFTKSEQELADSIVAASTAALGPAGAALLATYQKTGAVRFSAPGYVGNTGPVFQTPTGRLEPYSERVQVNYPAGGWIPTSAGVDPLPFWEPPAQAWPENPLYKKYPLAYMQEHSRWRVHTTYFDQPWLREVNPEPYVDLSTADAKARGIAQGDYVEVFNDYGRTVAVARVTGKMRPGQVNLPKGWQRFQTRDDTGFSDVTHNWLNYRNANGAYFDNLVEVRKVVV